jgi:hypothetical protein
MMLDLTAVQVNRKYQAIRLYKSQMSDSAYWLTAFARRNELFTPVDPIELVEGADWSPHRTAVASAETSDYERVEETGHVLGVSYRNDPQGLMVKVDLRHPLKLALGAAVEAFGYRSHTPFGKMPKLRIEYLMGKLVVRDQDVKIPVGGIRAELKDNFGELIIPWKMLGNPEAIFVQTHGLSGLLSKAYTPWQVFTLTKQQTNHRGHGEGSEVTEKQTQD